MLRLAKRLVYLQRAFDIDKIELEESINKFINLEFSQYLRGDISSKLDYARMLIENGR